MEENNFWFTDRSNAIWYFALITVLLIPLVVLWLL
ncbi:uncharacterized protein METZ01_LOCUS514786 [marine metagenome]|uniref:Uncharacterized protein n=1 Tax=marine metagenome TaxID=408172 RepID=A0A383EYB0_9ZZZZ